MLRISASASLLTLLSLLAVGCGSAGEVSGVPSDNANLAGLALSVGSLAPAFSPDTTTYTLEVGFLAQHLTVIPTAEDGGAVVMADGAPIPSGTPSAPIALSVGPTPVLIEVTSADGSKTRGYTVVVTRAAALAHRAYVKASNTGSLDDFGTAVAVSGDTLVVGAPGEDSIATGVDGDQADQSASSAGAVYVFVREAGTWSQQAYLKASNTEMRAAFGASVAISGDTLVVGSPRENSAAIGVDGDQADDSAFSAGASYVFVRTAGTWSQQAYLKASNTGVSDQFGAVVAISGNMIVVGALSEDSNATGVNGDGSDDSLSGSGAAYVFERTGTTWSQQAYLKASNTEAGDEFGISVSVSGESLVIGARREDSDATGVGGDESNNLADGSGAAYVFVRTAGLWSQQAYLKASNAETGDKFGRAVAISGDTLIVGATSEQSGATGVNGDESDNLRNGTGAAYVFSRTGTVWIQQAYLKPTVNAAANDAFGSAVALWGDTLVVGALNEDSRATGLDGDAADNSASTAGAAWVFKRAAGVWSHQTYVKATNTEGSAQFGASVSVSGDTIVVGSPEEDGVATGVNGDASLRSPSSSSAGSAYVLR